MHRPDARDVRRRDFLRWLAASPLLASAGGLATLEPLIAQEAPRRIFDDIAAADTLVLPAHFEPCRLAREGEEFRFVFD